MERLLSCLNEIKRRHPIRWQRHRNSHFNAKIICAECGGYYGRKVWHSDSKYQKQVWRCNHKYEDETVCQTPNLTEEEIKAAFVEAFNILLSDKKRCIDRLTERLSELGDTKRLESELMLAREKHKNLMENLRQYMEANTREVQDQVEYTRRFNEMDKECQKAETHVKSLEQKILL